MALFIILSCIFSNIFGVALHFTHTKKSSALLIHMFSAVNESVWEHLKLAFIPMLFFSFIQKIFLGIQFFNVFEANLFGILFSLIFITTAYYLSKVIIKKENVIFDILLFIFSVCFSYVIVYTFIRSGFVLAGETVSLVLLALILTLFSIFSFYPPKHFLFQDPLTRKFGD